MEKHWHLLYTKPRKELIVLHQLNIFKIENFFPKLFYISKSSKELRSKPYFPRYIFIYVTGEKIIDPSIKWIPGVVEVVNLGGQPAVISEEIINKLKERVLIYNERIKNSKSKFEKGDLVFIKDGPFAGYKGIFNMKLSGSQRVKILLEVLHGNFSKLELSENNLRLKE